MEEHVTPFVPTQAHTAFEALVSALGKPSRRSISESPWWQSHSPDSINYLHPVFGMMKHFQSHDEGARGYTANHMRGDHVSIPGWSEEGGGIEIVEVSFHKGSTFIEIVSYPEADPAIAHAASAFLQSFETR